MNKKIPSDFVSTQREIIAECAHIRSTKKKRNGAIRIWRKERNRKWGAVTALPHGTT